MTLYATRARKHFVMPDLSLYMTTEDTATRIGYNTESIRRLLRERKLQGIKVGRIWLVEKASIEKFIKETAGLEKSDPRRGK